MSTIFICVCIYTCLLRDGTKKRKVHAKHSSHLAMKLQQEYSAHEHVYVYVSR